MIKKNLKGEEIMNKRRKESKEMEYTKGEWYWEHWDATHHSLKTEEGDCILCVGKESPFKDVDAQLIAAAPEMYEACLEALGFLSTLYQIDRDIEVRAIASKLLSALAKTEM